MSDEVVGRKPKSYPNWHRIKLYTVVITDSLNSTIWYAGKMGKSFHAVLSPKCVHGGWAAMFRVVDLSEDGTTIKDPLLIRYINPCDCNILEEKQMRIVDRMERLLVGKK
jgi:hypothetical protein